MIGWWTPERLDQLHDLEMRGLSDREMGIIMGTTKNAIAGKLTRLGIIGFHRTNRHHKWAEKERVRKEDEARMEADRIAAEKENERRRINARAALSKGVSCTRPDCTKPRQPGYPDGLCAEHRRDLMPDRTRADMVADVGPVGW